MLFSSKVFLQGVYLDPNFGNMGKTTITFGEVFETSPSIALQADGKILVAGYVRPLGAGTHGTVTRLHPDGNIDSTFGSDGSVLLTSASHSIYLQNLTIQSDGKIFAGGYSNNSFIIYKLNSDGTLDTTFNNQGFVTTRIYRDDGNATISYLRKLALYPNGKILAVGSADGFIGMARYNPNGSLDGTFDNDGTLAFPAGGGTRTTDMLIQPDGKISVIGWTVSSPNRFSITQFHSNGTVDLTYGNQGNVLISLGGGSSHPWACALQKDKLVVVGTYNEGTMRDFAVTRFNPNGTIDPTFNETGVIFTDFNDETDVPNDVLVLPNNKILVSGKAGGTNETYFGLALYRQDGTLDLDFGTDGKFTVGFNGSGANLREALIQEDGKIIAGGSAVDTNGDTDIALARFILDSRPQPSAKFDFDGDSKTDIGVFRPSLGQWWYLRSSDSGNSAFAFGTKSDTLIPADYTGDGKTDIAFWRESTGEWFVLRSEDSSFYSFPFGISGDVPAPGDYDGDGSADPAVFRPSNSTWFILNSGGGTTIQQFGADGDAPIAQDYDGDGKDDLAIFRPSVGEWFYQRSSDLQVIGYQFGTSSDKAIPSDYTGDGKADIGFWRPSSGEWFILRSEDNSFFAFPFGSDGDIPVPGDYDGDGKADAAVFRPSNNTWFKLQSTDGFEAVAFGIANDVPIPSAYIP